MQRLHPDDLSGHLLATEPEEWDVVKVPSLKDNVSFWEERYPVEELLRIQRTNAFLFQSQYQQSPIFAGGSVIKTEWFGYYSTYENVNFRRLFFTADTAQKVKQHNDWSVFSFWGVSDAYLYWIDMLRGKWEAPELTKMAKAIWQKWKGGINGTRPNAFYVEDKVSGTGLIQELKANTRIPIIAIPRDKDKLTRVEDGLPHIECGRVLLPIDKTYSFNPLVLGECEAFQRDDSHKWDDIIDTMMDAIQKGLSKRQVSILDVVK